MMIQVLRLDHRPARDKRVTTHLLLAARAFGAYGAFYTGTKDTSIEGTIERVGLDWGGNFKVAYINNWKGLVNEWKRQGKVVHLTMYGLPIQNVIDEVRENASDKLIVVGGAKVPGEMFGQADWNVAVTSQPHSEVSALAVFLHMLFEGRELNLLYEGAKLRIVPQRVGKRVDRSAYQV